MGVGVHEKCRVVASFHITSCKRMPLDNWINSLLTNIDMSILKYFIRPHPPYKMPFPPLFITDMKLSALLHQSQQNHTPGVPVPLGGRHPPHHNIMVSGLNRNSMCSSDSEPEEESAFAKALREKKLKKTSSSIAF